MIDYNSRLPAPPYEIREEDLQEYRQSFYDIELSLLDSALSIELFHKKLSQIIMLTPDFSEAQLEKLTLIVSKPWKQKKGRSVQEFRRFEIIDHYIQMKMEGKNITRKQMLNFIMSKFKLTEEAAVKEFNISFKVKKPENIIELR